MEGEKVVLFVLDHLAGKSRLDTIGRLYIIGKDDTDKIFFSLRNTFWNGDTIPQLLQRFFSYSQSTEDLVSCSLNLLEMFDRIAEHDHTFRSNKNSVLKDRLAEAVRDERLRRELRRLNTENPSLSYFDFRDRGDKWLGKGPKKSVTNVEEVRSQQSIDIDKLKQDIVSEVVQALKPQLNKSQSVPKRKRQCWECGSQDHIKQNCEIWKENKEVTNQDVIINNGEFLKKAVGVCPETIIDINSKRVRCLLDTGAEVSTMTESFFKENFNETLADISDYVKITSANRLQTPFIGYHEPTIRIFDREVREAEFSIVKDPEDLHLANRKHAVPGVAGSSIFNVLANNPNDFDKNEIPVATEILSLYNQEISQDKGRTGFAKIGGQIVIPRRSLKPINVKIPPQN